MRIVVGFSPGGIADVTVRLIVPRLTEALGQPIIVENRPGASGAIATERVAGALADGYTLLAPTAADAPFVLVVHPSVPARNVKALIALSRVQPGKVSYGSVGIDTTPHLSAEALKVIANVSGLIDMVFASMPSLTPVIGAGSPRLRALAVTSIRRVSFAPELPTLNESGVAGYDRSSWAGLLAPVDVPNGVIAKLNTALAKVVNTPEMRAALGKQGLEAQTTTPDQYAIFINNQLEQNARLIRATGLKLDG